MDKEIGPKPKLGPGPGPGPNLQGVARLAMTVGQLALAVDASNRRVRQPDVAPVPADTTCRQQAACQPAQQQAACQPAERQQEFNDL